MENKCRKFKDRIEVLNKHKNEIDQAFNSVMNDIKTVNKFIYNILNQK